MSIEDRSEGDDRPDRGSPGWRRRWSMARRAAVVAGAILVALAVAVVVGNDRPATGRSWAAPPGPGEPGAEVEVTAALDWRGGSTGGWAYQHPAGWRVSSGASCGTDVVVVLLANADIDACA